MYEDMPIEEACIAFQYDTQNLLHEMDITTLLIEHQFYVENGYEMSYTDDYGYMTEGSKSVWENIVEKIKQFAEWCKHLWRKMVLWIKEYWNKLLVWWNTKKSLIKENLEVHKGWEYKMAPMDVLSSLIGFSGLSIVDGDQELLDSFMEILDEQKPGDSTTITFDLQHRDPENSNVLVTLSIMAEWMTNGKEKMNTSIKHFFNEIGLIHKRLYSNIKNDVYKDSDSHLLRSKLKVTTKLLSKSATLIVKMARFYQFAAKDMIRIVDTKYDIQNIPNVYINRLRTSNSAEMLQDTYNDIKRGYMYTTGHMPINLMKFAKSLYHTFDFDTDFQE